MPHNITNKFKYEQHWSHSNYFYLVSRNKETNNPDYNSRIIDIYSCWVIQYSTHLWHPFCFNLLTSRCMCTNSIQNTLFYPFQLHWSIPVVFLTTATIHGKTQSIPISLHSITVNNHCQWKACAQMFDCFLCYSTYVIITLYILINRHLFQQLWMPVREWEEPIRMCTHFFSPYIGFLFHRGISLCITSAIIVTRVAVYGLYLLSVLYCQLVILFYSSLSWPLLPFIPPFLQQLKEVWHSMLNAPSNTLRLRLHIWHCWISLAKLFK